jgi:long-chain acyl-CoA synthetase
MSKREDAMNRTIPQMFVDLARERRSRPALRHRKDGTWQDIPWEELSDRFRLFGRGLLALGLNEGDRVAIMAPNGPDWVFADLGCMAAGGFPVALYNTEGVTTVLHCLKDSGSRFLFLHSPEFGRALAPHLTELPALERIILLQGESDHPVFLSVAEFLTRAGEVADGALDARLAAGEPERLVTLIYTSGTTGAPKGAVLSHAAILANVEACSNLFPLGPDDICLSFLPLSHVFERVDGYYFMLSRGVVIAYAESLEAVPANLAVVRPTVMICVSWV